VLAQQRRPRQTLGITREGRRQNLDRDVPAQLRVTGPIHLAHPAFIDLGQDFVEAQSAPDDHRAFSTRITRQRSRRRTEEAGCARFLRQQRFDFLPQRVVAGASLHDERRALTGFPLRRRLRSTSRARSGVMRGVSLPRVNRFQVQPELVSHHDYGFAVGFMSAGQLTITFSG
jgi:hypothetical protein